MRKATFYGLAILCGLASLPCGLVIHEILSGGACSYPKSARVEQDFLAIGNALKTYKINGERLPTTAQGLEALVDKPKTGPMPKRWVQILRKPLLDPWLTPYRYTLLSPKDYEWRWELRSAGADRTFGTDDDLMDEW